MANDTQHWGFKMENY